MAYKKFISILTIFVCFSSFSQAKSDWNEILSLVITSYNADNINVYYKFDNSMAKSNLKNAYLIKESNYLKDNELNKNSLDDAYANLYHDTVTLAIENIKLPYSKSIELCQKLNNRKIEKYYKGKLHRKRDKPLAYLSIPLIATDNKNAKVYCRYISGALSGNIGVFNLEKINGKWSIINYDIKGVL